MTPRRIVTTITGIACWAIFFYALGLIYLNGAGL